MLQKDLNLQNQSYMGPFIEGFRNIQSHSKRFIGISKCKGSNFAIKYRSTKDQKSDIREEDHQLSVP